MSLPLATNLNIIPILQFSFFTPPSKRLRESTLGLHSCFLINIQTCKAEREKNPTSRLSVNRLSVTRPPFHFRCERICFFFLLIALIFNADFWGLPRPGCIIRHFFIQSCHNPIFPACILVDLNMMNVDYAAINIILSKCCPSRSNFTKSPDIYLPTV